MITTNVKSKTVVRVSCKYCRGRNVVKNGLRNNTQFWLCRDCGHAFVNNQALPKMKYPLDLVVKSVEKYYEGVSLHNISKEISQTAGSLPSISVVYEWIRKLTQSGLIEVRKHVPRVGDVWVVSIVSIWLNHHVYIYINIFDAGTQFIIASKLGKFEDIKTVFENARKLAGKSPRSIVTNGWRGYMHAVEQVFGADTSHIVVSLEKCPQVSADFIAYLEYWRSVFKTKYKHLHSLDENIQMIVDGMVLQYNFFRLQEGLGKKTPAEAARIALPFHSWQDIAGALFTGV
jgi:transposase-like protein